MIVSVIAFRSRNLDRFTPGGTPRIRLVKRYTNGLATASQVNNRPDSVVVMGCLPQPPRRFS